MFFIMMYFVTLCKRVEMKEVFERRYIFYIEKKEFAEGGYEDFFETVGVLGDVQNGLGLVLFFFDYILWLRTPRRLKE